VFSVQRLVAPLSKTVRWKTRSICGEERGSPDMKAEISTLSPVKEGLSLYRENSNNTRDEIFNWGKENKTS
jgi:hypothetical protein